MLRRSSWYNDFNRRYGQREEDILKNGVATFDDDVNMIDLKFLHHDALNYDFFQSLIPDELNYYCAKEDYSKMHQDLSKKYVEIVRSGLKYVPAPHMRKGNFEAIAFAMTLSELFDYVDNATKLAQATFPCKILKKFQDYIPKIEEARKNGYVELPKYGDILDFRDEILDHMRKIYRGRKDEEKIEYPKLKCDRYCPYDYDWICGSNFTGPEQVLCLKYMCAARMFQMHLVHLRMQNLSVFCEVEGDCTGLVFFPIAEDLVDTNLLSRHLRNREFFLRHQNESLNDIMIDSYGPNTSEFRFVFFTNLMTSVQEMLSYEKRRLNNKLICMDIEDCIKTHLLIGVLVAVETQILLLQRTYALFVDAKLGMFGKAIPDRVVNMAWKIVEAVSNEEIPKNPLNPVIEQMLVELRALSHKAISDFFTIYEETCEELNKNKLIEDKNVVDHEGNYTYEVRKDDFRHLGVAHYNRMKTNLFWEKTEIKRLDAQLIKVRNAYEIWPSYPGCPELTTFGVTDRIVALVSNVHYALPDYMLDPTESQTRTGPPYARTYNIASDIIQTIKSVIAQDQTTPDVSDTVYALKTSFEDIFKGMKIDGWRPDQYGEAIARVVLVEIDESRHFFGCKTPSASIETATKLAEQIGKLLKDYINKGEKLQAQQRFEITKRHIQLWLGVGKKNLEEAYKDYRLSTGGGQPGPSSSSS